MKEHPILFSGPMVRAILSGAKTQTRRVCVPQFTLLHQLIEHGGIMQAITERIFRNHPGIKCPYGTVGYRLWVRETWYHNGCLNCPVHYRATEPEYKGYEYRDGGWKPSIHMPRWASRITLEITDIRVQRVQEITEEDAKAEGVKGPFDELFTPRRRFEDLWDSINAKRGYSWESNPWVWALTFRRIKC